ncbi:MAG: hypothetical protein NT086_22465 [Proteobacteria bacterium]|nr:hypothetical protein [Pseudomonadota bacterium]
MEKTIHSLLPKQLELDFGKEGAVDNIIYASFGKKKSSTQESVSCRENDKVNISLRLNEILARYK